MERCLEVEDFWSILEMRAGIGESSWDCEVGGRLEGLLCFAAVQNDKNWVKRNGFRQCDYVNQFR